MILRLHSCRSRTGGIQPAFCGRGNAPRPSRRTGAMDSGGKAFGIDDKIDFRILNRKVAKEGKKWFVHSHSGVASCRACSLWVACQLRVASPVQVSACRRCLRWHGGKKTRVIWQAARLSNLNPRPQLFRLQPLRPLRSLLKETLTLLKPKVIRRVMVGTANGLPAFRATQRVTP